MADLKKLDLLLEELKTFNASLVAVSKLQDVEDIEAVIAHGHFNFGENYVQELLFKQPLIPNARWHFIGHLQSNKVKQVVPHVTLIHGVDSSKLLNEVSKLSVKAGKVTDVLLQVYIAMEETKFGLSENEASKIIEEFNGNGVRICGLMGMASLTGDENKIAQEFRGLKKLFDELRKSTPGHFKILSMGMSSDYKIALQEGSTMVRIGSLIFGDRGNKGK